MAYISSNNDEQLSNLYRLANALSLKSVTGLVDQGILSVPPNAIVMDEKLFLEALLLSISLKASEKIILLASVPRFSQAAFERLSGLLNCEKRKVEELYGSSAEAVTELKRKCQQEVMEYIELIKQLGSLEILQKYADKETGVSI